MKGVGGLVVCAVLVAAGVSAQSDRCGGVEGAKPLNLVGSGVGASSASFSVRVWPPTRLSWPIFSARVILPSNDWACCSACWESLEGAALGGTFGGRLTWSWEGALPLSAALRFDGIRDIVFVGNEGFRRENMAGMAAEVGDYNAHFKKQRLPYMLIGPGRWGTTDRWLGIPVVWTDISWARAIVETEMEGIKVEPSQGSHFFHNMTAFQVGYMTADPDRGTGWIDWEWLLRQEVVDFHLLAFLLGPGDECALLHGWRKLW